MSRGHGKAERHVLASLADTPNWVTVELMAARYVDPNARGLEIGERYGYSVSGLDVWPESPKILRTLFYWDYATYEAQPEGTHNRGWVSVDPWDTSTTTQHIKVMNRDACRTEYLSVDPDLLVTTTQHIPPRAALESVRRAAKRLAQQELLTLDYCKAWRGNTRWEIKDGELIPFVDGEQFMLMARRPITAEAQAAEDELKATAKAESDERIANTRALLKVA